MLHLPGAAGVAGSGAVPDGAGAIGSDFSAGADGVVGVVESAGAAGADGVVASAGGVVEVAGALSLALAGSATPSVKLSDVSKDGAALSLSLVVSTTIQLVLSCRTESLS